MKLRLLALLALSLPTLLPAQEAARLNCRFLRFERGSQSPAPLYVMGAEGKEPTECPLPQDQLSKPVALSPVNGTLAFHAAPQGGGEPVAVAKVPTGLTQALLMFLPSDEENRAYNVVVLDGSEKGYPKDGALVVNLYNQDVRFILGEHKVQLPPGKVAALGRPAQRDNFNMAPVAFQFRTDDQWRMAYESMIRFPEEQRHLFVSYVDPRTKRPRVRSYRD